MQLNYDQIKVKKRKISSQIAFSDAGADPGFSKRGGGGGHNTGFFSDRRQPRKSRKSQTGGIPKISVFRHIYVVFFGVFFRFQKGGGGGAHVQKGGGGQL